MTFADAIAAHEHDEEQDRLAADQTPATERCGECRLGLGVHTITDPYCAHHQTPATDSERAERLGVSRRLADEVRTETAGDDTLLDDIAAAMLDLDDEVTRLTALLAEQAATIERVRAVHTPLRRVISVPTFDYFDSPTQVINGCACGSQTYPCQTLTALGSQRTEGQG